MKVIKFIKYIPLVLINYILIFFLIYIVSGFLLLKKITPNIKLITEYQRNFYIYGGLRNIWQSQKECINFDKDLIYVPKYTTCNFNNIEFNTKVSFNEKGRYSNHIYSDKKGIAVLGDSHAMGWGVNDNETFSHFLAEKIKRPVYNLAVSSYGTKREIIRLEKSGLLEKIDTIIIQYCFNDVGENQNFKFEPYNVSKQKFDSMLSIKPMGNYAKFRKAVRYSVTIPFDIITKKNKFMDFDGHKEVLHKILKQHPSIKDKKIIIFYSNGFDMKFHNFPNGKSQVIKNVEFLDLDIGEEYYFKVDGHLNIKGHSFVADEISKVLN